MRLASISAVPAIIAGCGKLQGLGGDVPALVTIPVEITGDVASLVPDDQSSPPDLHIALVWGAQWLSERICIEPPESDAMAAVLTAGCRDPFRFVPSRVAAVAPVAANAPSEIAIFTLPSADTMIGSVSSRVAYASFVVFDDRDATGTLELGVPHHTPSGEDGGEGNDYVATKDIVYGASFLTMTAPDQRLAYREGSFDLAAAFYPRSGCAVPSKGFSILAAGGFTSSDAIAAALRGELPAEDPTKCSEAIPQQASVTIPLRSPDDVREAGCAEPDDIVDRYLQPPADSPDFSDRVVACGHTPDFGDKGADIIQVVVSGRSDDPCRSLTHYVLRGCREDPTCAVPEWDFTMNRPQWWAMLAAGSATCSMGPRR